MAYEREFVVPFYTDSSRTFIISYKNQWPLFSFVFIYNSKAIEVSKYCLFIQTIWFSDEHSYISDDLTLYVIRWPAARAF